MKTCIYAEDCPVFARFTNAEAADVWIVMYCRGDRQSECVRLAHRQRGETPPVNMLPNGELWEFLKDD